MSQSRVDRPLSLVRALLLTGALALTANAAQASELDWELHADVEVIEIVTADDDGEVRETKVWFVLIDGVPTLRTSGSRWLENIRRDPMVTIRIEDDEYLQVAEEVTSDEMIERVDEASRAKYGWQDAFIHFFRVSDPDILALSEPDI